MFVGQMRKKEKKFVENGSNKENNKKSHKVCPDYTSRLNEYRDGLWDLRRSDLELEAEDASDCQKYSGCHSDDLTQTVQQVTTGAGTCLGPGENRKLENFHTNRMSHPSHRSNGQCDSAIFRNSMHWEDFFGSSLDLAPSLLSIYDSIALGTKTTEDEGGTDQSETSIKSPTNQNSTPTNSPTNQHPSEAPSIKIDANHSKCDLNHSRMCEVAGTNNNNDDDSDSKKRPLSISSMSSSSSSSLPRYSHKRPNLSQFDPVILGRSDMEKLDSLLFIDDDAPSGNTDEEMSVDTDGESCRKCDKDGASIQSSASLSSTETNENQEKSSPSTPDQTLIGTTKNTNDLELPSDDNNGESCHGDQNNNQASISYSSPDFSSFTSQEDKSLSAVSPPSVGSGTPLVTTPLSRHSSVSRDGTSPMKYVTYVQRVVAEIVETERIYVRYLKEIIDGYLEFLGRSSELRISETERACLFGNILEIYEFSRGFLEELEQCEDDPLKVAACFVKNNEGFSIYAEYCTNYPSAIEVLTGVMMHPELSELIKQQQVTLGHNLPLGAYLLKPVQRVLKYHLLLHNLLKNYNKKDPGHEILSQALEHMTGMAQHINEMKRKHEHAVRVQEIQSQLEEYDGEDLTRLGELVLEGAFRIYGAKTSRHVFLFEKGILIAKRKEDSMLSSKGFILCSNLMLVESIPKEPLSFQVIPFDNPRGQHMLQARNLDQKRKWCQEIKRLILESYKGMIPENVKGLVMQLGKSREEETAKPADLEPKKFHHHQVPEYLEKRQRLRRKSGGTLIADILKPQWRKNRRGESVSPRVSPTMQRKRFGMVQTENSLFNKDMDKKESISRETTSSDIASMTPGDNDVDSLEEVTYEGNVSRNHSFKSAVMGDTFCEYAVEETDLNDVAKHPERVSRRTRSFRMATRLKPLRSFDMEDERISSSSPNTPSDSREIDFKQHTSSSSDTHADKAQDNRRDKTGSREHCNSQNGLLSRSDTYSSMPALSETDKDFVSPDNERRDFDNGSFCSSRKPSTDSFKSLGNFQQSKRIIDAKQYFKRDISGNNSTESFDSSNNLRRDSNTISALHDSYLQKSLENTCPTSPKLSCQSPKRLLSRSLPLTIALKSLGMKTEMKGHSQICSDSESDSASKGTFAYSSEVSESNPWIPNNDNFDFRKNYLTRRQRSHSTDCELDEVTRENLNMDWIVYANRNSLPVTGYSMDDIPKLFKYCTPPREEMDKLKKSPNLPHESLIKSFATPPRSSMDPANMQKYNSEVRYSLPPSLSSGESESDKSSTLGTLPTFYRKPLSLSKIQDNHNHLTRSNSTPCARVAPVLLNRRARTLSEDMDNIINDHEKIVAEMEDYMKKSNSNVTLNTSNSKFPTTFQVITSEDEADQTPNRDSIASNYSSSSYESQDSYESPHNESIVDTLKSKISEFKNKITHRRSGSYDNKNNNNFGQDFESENDSKMKHGSRSSLLSLNSWFSHSQKSKDQEEPDLQSILQAGELGGAAIGERMADPEPLYEELGFLHKRNKEQLQVSCSFSVDDNIPSPDSSSLPSKEESATQLPTIQNLNIQQCDSAFSIGESCNLEDSPRNNSVKSRSERRGSDSSGGSFYERRLSLAFEEGDAFRDSAVYCEMDVDTVSPSVESQPVKCQPRLPIKAFIQKLEESSKSKQLTPYKVSAREPSAMVKKKMECLQNSAVYKKSFSRPVSEERELKACINRARSRPVSEERELSPITFKTNEKDLSPLLASMKGEMSSRNFGSEKNLFSSRSSVEREISPFSSGSKFLRSSTPCREDRPLRRELSDVGYSFRSRSNTPVRAEMKSSKSLNRLDQIGNDMDNLVIMKGWVRQLIQKFQPSNS